jgi:hypothetical protein
MAEDYYKTVLNSTIAIAFMGTPHAGSSWANIAKPFAKLLGYVKSTNREVLDALRPESEVLAQVQSDFHNMLRDRAANQHRPLGIVCFYEELGVKGIGEVGFDGNVRRDIKADENRSFLSTLLSYRVMLMLAFMVII